VSVQRGVQSVFRAANERLRARMEELFFRGPRPVICECSDPECMKVLQLKRGEYQSIRDSGYFIVATGHETPDIEQVVARRDGYLVVHKT
jgi:hypothetical protein